MFFERQYFPVATSELGRLSTITFGDGVSNSFTISEPT